VALTVSISREGEKSFGQKSKTSGGRFDDNISSRVSVLST
jgi:hypothetical protein